MQERLGRLETLCHALGDRTRLRIVRLLAVAELNVNRMVEILEMPQPKVSRHLAYLRRAKIVRRRRAGKRIHYRLSRRLDEATMRVLRTAIDTLADDPVCRRDFRALVRLQAVRRRPSQPAV